MTYQSFVNHLSAVKNSNGKVIKVEPVPASFKAIDDNTVEVILRHESPAAYRAFCESQCERGQAVQ
jgi:hypothetical protein